MIRFHISLRPFIKTKEIQKYFFCCIQNLIDINISIAWKIFSEFGTLAYMQELSQVIFSQHIPMNDLDDVKIEMLQT